MRAVLIAPTRSKNYRNPHIARIWYGAERLLHEAKRVVIVGYSLPPEDLEVVQLLRRGLMGGEGSVDVTVVDFDKQARALEEHPVGLRYRSVFGPGIQWEVGGFEKWREWIDGSF